jgi:hypothetical protein
VTPWIVAVIPYGSLTESLTVETPWLTGSCGGSQREAFGNDAGLVANGSQSSPVVSPPWRLASAVRQSTT